VPNYEEKCQLDKYKHCLYFKINTNGLTKNILKTIYGKCHIVENNKNVLLNNKNSASNKIIEIINEIGFKIENSEIVNTIIDKNKLTDVKLKIAKHFDKQSTISLNLNVNTVSKFFRDENMSNKKFLGFLNTLLRDHGFEINTIGKKVYENDKRKSEYVYKLDFSKIIKNIKNIK
jgi:hypothetical protein